MAGRPLSLEQAIKPSSAALESTLAALSSSHMPPACTRRLPCHPRTSTPHKTHPIGGSRLRLGAAAALLGAGVGAGVVAGVAIEQALIGRRLRRLRRIGKSEEPFGLLRGEVIDVLAEDGVPLHVEVDEPVLGASQDGLTTIFVHGYSLNQDCFHYQRRDLGSLGRLVFPDQRAHGRSLRGRSERNTIDQLGRDLQTVIEAVAPTGPLVLVGHSMGGMTILTLAAQRPDYFQRRVAGVALLATTTGELPESFWGLPDAVGKVVHRLTPTVLAAAVRRQELVEASRKHASDLVFLLSRRYSFGSKVSPAMTQFVADMVADTPVDVIAEYMAALEEYRRPESVAVLEGIETLIMVGDRDLLTPPRHSHEIVRRAPHAEFVLLPDTGHMLMIERYPEVNQQLRDLVGRVRQGIGERSGTGVGT